MRKLALLVVLALTVSWANTADAAIVITEVMSNSSHPGGSANGDWFEITNTGPGSVDLTGYYWDDDGPAGNDGALFPALSMAANESIVIVDEADAPGFAAAWGGGFTAISRDEFGGNDNFSGLSSGGDQIQIWDADPNAGPANLVAEAFFDASTDGSSFEWFTNGMADGLSIAGEFGAFTAPGDGAGGVGSDIGSPGIAAVPEPSSAIAAFLGMACLLRRRRSA